MSVFPSVTARVRHALAAVKYNSPSAEGIMAEAKVALVEATSWHKVNGKLRKVSATVPLSAYLVSPRVWVIAYTVPCA